MVLRNSNTKWVSKLAHMYDRVVYTIRNNVITVCDVRWFVVTLSHFHSDKSHDFTRELYSFLS